MPPDVHHLRRSRRFRQDDAGGACSSRRCAPRAATSSRPASPAERALGERIRDLLLHGDAIAPWTEATLFAAARAQLVAEVIRPALDRGADVVCDRFLDSSLAYQGIARGLGVDRVLELNVIATGGLLPDRTFLLELPLDQAKARRGDEPDRMEAEGDGFAGRVQDAYRELAQIFRRGAIVPIDATAVPRGASDAGSVQSFETFPEQDEAKRLLTAPRSRRGRRTPTSSTGRPASGKRRAALAFAGELLGSPDRVAREAHPDLYVLEPLGDQIRIDPIREMRRDLHMRPFEADRRVYIVGGAHLMNEDAADALLKDLEEPPPYAVIVLVADELGPLPETIRSRCQLVPFRRLSRGAVKTHLAARGLTGEELEIAARVAAGRLDRAERLLDAKAGERRFAVLDLARAAYRDDTFEPAQGGEDRRRAGRGPRAPSCARSSSRRPRRRRRSASRRRSAISTSA